MLPKTALKRQSSLFSSGVFTKMLLTTVSRQLDMGVGTSRTLGVHGAGVLGAILTYIQGVSENTDTFVLSIVSMFLPVVSWDKDPKIASLMEIC